MNSLSKIHRFLLKTETLILVCLLISLIVIAVIQVMMRNLFGGGLLWADAYTRISVLWIAMLGAMAASRERKHIAIDILIRYLPELWKQKIQRLSSALTGAICITAAWFSASFVEQEYEYGDIAFANFPTWTCELIIPVAFIVIGLRYCVAVFLTENHSD